MDTNNSDHSSRAREKPRSSHLGTTNSSTQSRTSKDSARSERNHNTSVTMQPTNSTPHPDTQANSTVSGSNGSSNHHNPNNPSSTNADNISYPEKSTDHDNSTPCEQFDQLSDDTPILGCLNYSQEHDHQKLTKSSATTPTQQVVPDPNDVRTDSLTQQSVTDDHKRQSPQQPDSTHTGEHDENTPTEPIVFDTDTLISIPYPAHHKKHNRIVLLVSAVIVTIITGIAATIGYRFNNSYHKLTTPNITGPTLPYETYVPEIVPLSTYVTHDLPTSMTSALAKITANPTLGTMGVEISDAATGKILWSKNPQTPLVPASTLKLLTAMAALLALPLDHRLATTVVSGEAAGTIVLVGTGDPTVSTLGLHQGYYPDAPRISDLANQVHNKYQHNITKIIVDESFFTGKTLAPSWTMNDVWNGDIAPIVPTMVDGGRIDPTYESARTDRPGIQAGLALAKALHLPSSTPIELGNSPLGAKTLATVYSAPLLERLRQMLLMSDNVMAEEISMEIANATGKPLTFDGGVQSVHDTLVSSGIDLHSVTMADTNGLSHEDHISAHDLNQLILAGTKNSTTNRQLRLILNLLPVSGRTGTLSHRFVGKNHRAAGHVRAKTGSLNGVNSLAGVVTTKQGVTLSFALISNSSGNFSNYICDQLDTLITTLYDSAIV